MQNKIELVADVASRGFTFSVLHDAWLVHLPHEATAARSMMMKDMGRHSFSSLREDSLHRVVTLMYKRARKLMAKHRFTAAVDRRLRNAFRECAWLQEPARARLSSRLQSRQARRLLTARDLIEFGLMVQQRHQ